jgi:hypothetical protein
MEMKKWRRMSGKSVRKKGGGSRTNRCLLHFYFAAKANREGSPFVFINPTVAVRVNIEF